MIIWLNLNSRLQPQHRKGLEKALHKMLIKEVIGCVASGRSIEDDTGEVIGCSIEIDLIDSSAEDITRVVEIVEKFKIPFGSHLAYDEIKIPIGLTQGLGLYLDGVDLPAEVYKNHDVGEVVEGATKMLHDLGEFCSYWTGEKSSAIYFYGESYESMRDALTSFTETHPLCQNCSIVQIA